VNKKSVYKDKLYIHRKIFWLSESESPIFSKFIGQKPMSQASYLAAGSKPKNPGLRIFVNLFYRLQTETERHWIFSTRILASKRRKRLPPYDIRLLSYELIFGVSTLKNKFFKKSRSFCIKNKISPMFPGKRIFCFSESKTPIFGIITQKNKFSSRLCQGALEMWKFRSCRIKQINYYVAT
jgi:hypothetical protein